MLYAFSTSLALTAVLVSSPATQRAGKLARYSGSLRPVTLDLETGAVTRAAASTPKALATISDFPNLDLAAGFVGVDTGAGACEWIDHGVKGKNGNASDFVSNFTFAYCSAALDTLSGGVGGTTTISFREGYQLRGTPMGTEVGRFAITGLPANTASSSFFGGFRCFFIGVDLGNVPMCFADGAIGYGWRFEDVGTDGVLASTFPFLACVQSCSGAGPDGVGKVNRVDQYCPPGTLFSTFTFGTLGFPGATFTSVSMDIREVVSTSHTTSLFDPNGNTVSLTETAAPVLDAPWSVSLDCSGQPAGGVGLVRVTVLGKLASPTVLPQGALYIAGRAQDFGFLHSGVAVSVGATVPKDLSFACLPFQVQGFCGQTGGGGQLSNALCSTVNVP